MVSIRRGLFFPSGRKVNTANIPMNVAFCVELWGEIGDGFLQWLMLTSRSAWRLRASIIIIFFFESRR